MLIDNRGNNMDGLRDFAHTAQGAIQKLPGNIKEKAIVAKDSIKNKGMAAKESIKNVSIKAWDQTQQAYQGVKNEHLGNKVKELKTDRARQGFKATLKGLTFAEIKKGFKDLKQDYKKDFTEIKKEGYKKHLDNKLEPSFQQGMEIRGIGRELAKALKERGEAPHLLEKKRQSNIPATEGLKNKVQNNDKIIQEKITALKEISQKQQMQQLLIGQVADELIKIGNKIIKEKEKVSSDETGKDEERLILFDKELSDINKILQDLSVKVDDNKIKNKIRYFNYKILKTEDLKKVLKDNAEHVKKIQARQIITKSMRTQIKSYENDIKWINKNRKDVNLT